MKNRSFILAICLIWAMSTNAQVSDAARRVHEALKAFVASGEYRVSGDSFDNSEDANDNKIMTYHWGQVFKVENSNDATILLPNLKNLDMTLCRETVHAKEVLIHNPGENAALIPGIGIANNKVYKQMQFDQGQNIRLLSFEEPDGYRYAIILKWEQLKSGNAWIMTGTIYEIYGKKIEGKPFFQSYFQPKKMSAPLKYETDPPALQTYEELLAKTKQLCQIYDRETSGGKTAAVVVLHKLCESYPNKLTQEQYNTLIRILTPYTEKAEGQKHKDMFGYICYTLYQKSEHYKFDGNMPQSRPSMVAAATISTAQLRKFVNYNGLITNASEDLQQVDCKISGIAPAEADSITVRRTVSVFEKLGKFPVRNGRFSFSCRLPKDEVCCLSTKDKYYTYFWAEEQPIVADMTKETVKSQKATQQRNNFLNEMEAERLRILKIKDRVELDAANAKQRERYRQVIFQGNDDLLRAYAIFKIYTELTYDELKPFVSDQFRYSSHLLMAPVKEYFDGLEKRRPGKHYIEMQLTDTLNNAHTLKEYIGKGYVVLHFWESSDHEKYNISPRLRTLYDQYHAKGMQILSLAMDGNYIKQWTDRLKEENMPWPQLSTKEARNLYGICSWPETIIIGPDGTIVASPTTMEELEEELKRIYSTN